jgi:hypothetical protein
MIKATSKFEISGKVYNIGDHMKGRDATIALANGWAAPAPADPMAAEIAGDAPAAPAVFKRKRKGQ